MGEQWSEENTRPHACLAVKAAVPEGIARVVKARKVHAGDWLLFSVGGVAKWAQVRSADVNAHGDAVTITLWHDQREQYFGVKDRVTVIG